jgi:cytochrome c oxidase assembly factor CtaG
VRGGWFSEEPCSLRASASHSPAAGLPWSPRWSPRSTHRRFWWGLLYGRYGRAGYGAAVFYVFATVLHTGLLGAVLTFAGVPLYSSYLASSAARGADPLGDQQLAGLIMWVPAGVLLTLLGIGLFAAWIGEAERRQRQASIHAK